MWTATHVERMPSARLQQRVALPPRAGGEGQTRAHRRGRPPRRGGCQSCGSGIFVGQAAARNRPSSPQSERRNCHQKSRSAASPRTSGASPREEDAERQVHVAHGRRRVVGSAPLRGHMMLSKTSEGGFRPTRRRRQVLGRADSVATAHPPHCLDARCRRTVQQRATSVTGRAAAGVAIMRAWRAAPSMLTFAPPAGQPCDARQPHRSSWATRCAHRVESGSTCVNRCNGRMGCLGRAHARHPLLLVSYSR